jgi:hypothetical protein
MALGGPQKSERKNTKNPFKQRENGESSLAALTSFNGLQLYILQRVIKIIFRKVGHQWQIFH